MRTNQCLVKIQPQSIEIQPKVRFISTCGRLNDRLTFNLPDCHSANLPMSAHLGNTVWPSVNVIPNHNPRTTKRALPTASKTASACHIYEPPVCSTSTTPKSHFLDTSTIPPSVASMVQQYLPGSNA